ncbi:hypothetical protein GWI33_021444 [Rhynchophorus ferrugineus]|uniref:Uncharacterized protein n=1 Tax=Rhynchophorus ferrugineus TaxID=354439 RepID=A0A834HUM5_RHYFE|nr:hypothetical protein GWI33_021444 [Rhynchophorus ferrugineus]
MNISLNIQRGETAPTLAVIDRLPAATDLRPTNVSPFSYNSCNVETMSHRFNLLLGQEHAFFLNRTRRTDADHNPKLAFVIPPAPNRTCLGIVRSFNWILLSGDNFQVF